MNFMCPADRREGGKLELLLSETETKKTFKEENDEL
jgi:hypothetical protein